MATPASSRPAFYSANLPAPPPPLPPPPNPNPSSGELLLQLLQQGFSSSSSDTNHSKSNNNHNNRIDSNSSRDVAIAPADDAPLRYNSISSSSGGSVSRTSSIGTDEDQLRYSVQHDPAVAVMGPSHRLGDMSSLLSSQATNPASKGILPLHDVHHHHHHHYQNLHHLHQNSHMRLPVPPSLPFDGPFQGVIRSGQPGPGPDHVGLPSPAMDSPLFCATPNQFFRPYPYAVMDHNPNASLNRYGHMAPSPLAFRHPGLISNRHDMHAGFENPNQQQSPFPHNGFFSPSPLLSHVGTENPNLFSFNMTGNGVPQDASHLSHAEAENPKVFLLNRTVSGTLQDAPHLSYVGVENPKVFPLSRTGSGGMQHDTSTLSHVGTESTKLYSLSRTGSGAVVQDSHNQRVTAGNGELAAAAAPHLFTQFGSVEVEISPQPSAKECTPFTLLYPSFHTDDLTRLSSDAENLSSCNEKETSRDGQHLLMQHPQAKNGTSDGLIDSTSSFYAPGPKKPVDAHSLNCNLKYETERAQMSRSEGEDKRAAAMGSNQNCSSHWIAMGKDKSSEAVRPDSDEVSGKVNDHPRRRNFGDQDWRSRQSNAINPTQWKILDSGNVKSKEQFKKNNRLRSKLPVQQTPVGLPSGAKVESAPSSAIEQSKHALHTPTACDNIDKSLDSLTDTATTKKDVDSDGLAIEDHDETILGCIGFLELDKDNGADEESKHNTRVSLAAKDSGSDNRQRRPNLVKFNRREVTNRPDMENCTRHFISIFQTLIPSKDEELRRTRLLSTLEEHVSGIWPKARLYLFGSCANAFGVCNSDIDICLSIDGESSSRAEVVRMLADVLKQSQMQNVQALTHARVPIVKYSDPTTGISCDVCVNNMLAVVNTKLLHDYAQIDERLRQLAFMVKHWAKCRQVNETYRGTLSSYAYVLMCIHFLQQRKPPVLPCLQEMEPTYCVTVGDISCAYFDQVEMLKGFGQKNRETLADLVALFFDYWAFRHDYSHSVISIRTGKFLSKVEKDWTRRIGNERHLICIEDPFETSHDLGRVVDKHSIRVLREEFQRAAKIMRQNATPWVALFEPFVRQKVQDA